MNTARRLMRSAATNVGANAVVHPRDHVVAEPQPAPRPAKDDPVGVVLRLIDVLERENAALAAGDRGAIPTLATEKRLACRAWDEVARTLAAQGASGGFDAKQRSALRAPLERLSRTTQENQRRLSMMMVAHQRVMEIIAGAVRAADPAAGGYARDGGRSHPSAVALSPRALSFDCAM